MTVEPPELLTAGEGEVMMTFAISGMTCEGCKKTVTDAIMEVEGVKKIAVSLEENQARVIVDAAHAPSPEAVVAAVEAQGYEATLPK